MSDFERCPRKESISYKRIEEQSKEKNEPIFLGFLNYLLIISKWQVSWTSESLLAHWAWSKAHTWTKRWVYFFLNHLLNISKNIHEFNNSSIHDRMVEQELWIVCWIRNNKGGLERDRSKFNSSFEKRLRLVFLYAGAMQHTVFGVFGRFGRHHSRMDNSAIGLV